MVTDWSIRKGRRTAELDHRLKTGFTGALGLLLLVSSCAQHHTPPPEPPRKHAAKASSPPPEERPFPEHQAPPPAYGNKVVLAQDDTGLFR